MRVSGAQCNVCVGRSTYLSRHDSAVHALDMVLHAPRVQDLLREELAELLKLPGSSFKVELVMRLLGLTHARDTMIGSAMVSRLAARAVP